MPEDDRNPPTIPAPPTLAERDQISRDQSLIGDEWADATTPVPPTPPPGRD